MQEVARRIAQSSSRRGFLARLGGTLVGAAALPLLPVARAAGESQATGPADDPTACEYWRHCGMDGYLCSCCGGSHLACPPGTEPAAITWVGTCRNPADGKDYVISYNDCCGKSICGRCLCNRNEGEEPMYRPGRANDIDWCLGVKSNAYHCTTAPVIGVAAGPSGHR
jgi:methylamine dehydrogenase light chain